MKPLMYINVYIYKLKPFLINDLITIRNELINDFTDFAKFKLNNKIEHFLNQMK